MYLLLHNGYIITTLTATHPGGSDIVSLTPQVLDSLIEPAYMYITSCYDIHSIVRVCT